MIKRKEAQRDGFLAGIIAGVPLAIAMFLSTSVTGVPTYPDLFADPALFLIPGPLFGLLIDRLGFTAKTLLLAGLLEGQLLFGGVIGWFWAGRWGTSTAKKQWQGIAIVVGTLFLLLEFVVLPLVGGGLLGIGLVARTLVVALSYLASHIVFGVALLFAFRWLRARSRSAAPPSAPSRSNRRLFLASVASASLAVIGVGTFWRAIGGARVVGGADGRLTGEISSEITPVDRFYTVSKNLADPKVDGGPWRLELGGQVNRPLTLTYDTLRAMPSTEQYFTLSCISNPVGGDLIGNNVWKGVLLKDLIESAGYPPGIRKVVFQAADGYTDSIRLTKAIESRTMLAYEMNGARLTDVHGFPARLLIPSIYGMKNVKWITRIELLDREFLGYWAQKGWDDVAEIQTLSRIDVPLSGRTVSGPVTIGGIAHAGSRRIARVEVSVDRGRSWFDAQMKPPLGPDCWTIWQTTWNPPGPGQYDLRVRATDGLARVQVNDRRDSFPNGSTGWHEVSIRVV